MAKKSKATPGTDLVPAAVNTENIESLRIHSKKMEELNFGLNETVNKLLKEIESRDAEITHLREMLFSVTPNVVPTDGKLVAISDEEEIAQIQLEKLKGAARTRELTLDEVKRYDLLVKNKRLAQGNTTAIVDGKKLPANATPKDLVQIASNKKTEEK